MTAETEAKPDGEAKPAGGPGRAPRVRSPGGAGVEAALREAALELFAERGFHGTSMRDIAARAGTGVSHLYYYFPSKAEILKSMMLVIVRDLLAELERADARSGESPAARLAALVRTQVLFHSQRRAQAFVGRSELRSLEPADRREVIDLYDRVTAAFREVIADGVRQGVFQCSDGSQASIALVTMCNGVANWYRPEGPLSPQQIADRYATFALQLVGASSAATAAVFEAAGASGAG